MEFASTPEEHVCRLAEDGEDVLELRVEKRGLVLPDRTPTVTYSVRDRALLRTVVAKSCLARSALAAGRSALVLGNRHPVSRGLAALDVDPRPIATRSFLDRSAILPAGSVVERDVRPLDGYAGASAAEGELRDVSAFVH